jgi:hypothetical protein
MGVTKEDNFFKRTYLVTGDYSSDDTTNGGSNIVTYDYFALPAEKEVFGSRTYGTANEYNNSYVVQFTWYKTKANRIKNLGTSSTAKWWWLRSPRAAAANSFVDVGSAGSVSWASAAYSNASGVSGGLAPFCCL